MCVEESREGGMEGMGYTRCTRAKVDVSGACLGLGLAYSP